MLMVSWCIFSIIKILSTIQIMRNFFQSQSFCLTEKQKSTHRDDKVRKGPEKKCAPAHFSQFTSSELRDSTYHPIFSIM